MMSSMLRIEAVPTSTDLQSMFWAKEKNKTLNHNFASEKVKVN